MADHDVVTEPSRPPGILALLRRRWLVVLIPVILAPAVAYLISSLQEEQYEAETSVLIRDTGGLASTDAGREAVTNLRLLQLEELENRVEDELGGKLRADVDVFTEEDSNIATIAVTSASPQRAADVANAYADEFIALRKTVLREDAAEEIDAVEEQLSSLSAAEEAGPEGAVLNERLQELAVAGAGDAGARQFGRATPAENASSPRPLRDAVLGLFIGLLIGVAAAVFFERRDQRLRDPLHVQAAFGQPLVGRIPANRALAKSGPGRGEPQPEAAEAFRTLRANAQFLLREREAHSLLVTSPDSGDGKTTVAWNLARAEAAYGTRVLLIEADMRHPVLAKALGADGSRGLSQFLRHEGTLAEMVEAVELEDNVRNGSGPTTVDVLFAGPPPQNPAELLDTDRMKALLGTLPDAYDLLVIDTPPTALVSDAIPLLDRVGAVVVVARIGATPYHLIDKLRAQLANLQAPVLGVVANGVPIDSSSNSYYYSARKVEA